MLLWSSVICVWLLLHVCLLFHVRRSLSTKDFTHTAEIYMVVFRKVSSSTLNDWRDQHPYELIWEWKQPQLSWCQVRLSLYRSSQKNYGYFLQGLSKTAKKRGKGRKTAILAKELRIFSARMADMKTSSTKILENPGRCRKGEARRDINEKSTEFLQCFFAPELGLEPRTLWLTVRCSNQLSYSGMFVSNVLFSFGIAKVGIFLLLPNFFAKIL